MRKPIAAANWKMNGDRTLLKTFADAGLGSGKVEVIFALPAIFLQEAAGLGIKAIAGEDVSNQKEGAFTGEISAAMLKEASCTHCIIGHSERRTYHGEDETVLKEKWAQLKAVGIVPLYCIGESEVEYDAGSTAEAIARQMNPMIEAGLLDAETIIAYEPVWAIGTGKAATPEYAQKVHEMIRKIITAKYADIAEKIRILYGGSVKPENAAELIAQPDIDGFLVGGASLNPDMFGKIIGAIE